MSKSITFHNGTKVGREHNIRNPKYTDEKAHIDKSRKSENKIFIDRFESNGEDKADLRKVYEEIFGESIAEYNAKQKRSDRKITDYYQKIQDDKRKNICYECIVQIGDKDDTGYSSPLEKKALTKFVKEWEKRNPNLILVGAYMHSDEASSHLHIDYIPISTNNKRGLKIQNSLSGALREQGFTETKMSCTEQMQWENSERMALEKICQELGIDAKANQGLTGERYHLSVPEYKKARDKMNGELIEENKQLNEENKQLKVENNKLNKEIIRKTNSLNAPLEEIPEIPETVTVKNFLGKEKTRPITDEERTLKQQERNNLIKQNELQSQLLLLQERERIVQEQEQKQQAKIKKQNAELEQINNEINSLQTERANLQSDINSLQTEKANLQANISDIKADAINNALVNVNVLNDYYVNSDAYMTRFRAYNDTIEKGDKQYAKNNKNAEYGDNS